MAVNDSNLFLKTQPHFEHLPDEIDYKGIKALLRGVPEGKTKTSFLEHYKNLRGTRRTVSKDDIIKKIKSFNRGFQLKNIGKDPYASDYSMSSETEVFSFSLTFQEFLRLAKVTDQEHKESLKRFFDLMRKGGYSHFNQQSEIAHARIYKNGNYDGDKIWVIEEIQSDLETHLSKQMKEYQDYIHKSATDTLKKELDFYKNCKSINFNIAPYRETMPEAYKKAVLAMHEPDGLDELIKETMQKLSHNPKRDARLDLSHFKSVLDDWDVFLLKAIIEEAEKDGAKYIGMSKDSPAGLQKDSVQYKRLYLELPKNLGFQEVDNLFLSKSYSFNKFLTYFVEANKFERGKYFEVLDGQIKTPLTEKTADEIMVFDKKRMNNFYADWENFISNKVDANDELTNYLNSIASLLERAKSDWNNLSPQRKEDYDNQDEYIRKKVGFISVEEAKAKSGVGKKIRAALENVYSGEEYKELQHKYAEPLTEVAKRYMRNFDFKAPQPEQKMWIRQITPELKVAVQNMHESLDTNFSRAAEVALEKEPKTVLNYNDLKGLMSTVPNGKMKQELMDSYKGLRGTNKTVTKDDIKNKVLKAKKDYEIEDIGKDKYEQFSISQNTKVFLFKMSHEQAISIRDRLLSPEYEKLNNMFESYYKMTGEAFRSHMKGKWEIAHLRYNENVYQGKKFWFIEEIQSDWENTVLKSLENAEDALSSVVNSFKRIETNLFPYMMNQYVVKPGDKWNSNYNRLNSIVKNISINYNLTNELCHNMVSSNAETFSDWVQGDYQEFKKRRLELSSPKEFKIAYNQFNSLFADWEIWLLKAFVEKAKSAGVQILGMSQDTPGGLSKNAPKYKTLYQNLPKELGFKKINTPDELKYYDVPSADEFRDDIYQKALDNFMNSKAYSIGLAEFIYHSDIEYDSEYEAENAYNNSDEIFNDCFNWYIEQKNPHKGQIWVRELDPSLESKLETLHESMSLVSNFEKKSQKALRGVNKKKLTYDDIKSIMKSVPNGKMKDDVMKQFSHLRGTDKTVSKGDLKSKVKSKLFKKKVKDIGDKNWNQYTISGKASTIILKVETNQFFQFLKPYIDNPSTKLAAERIYNFIQNDGSHMKQGEIGWIRVNKEAKYENESMWFIEEIQSDLENTFIKGISGDNEQDKANYKVFRQIFGDWHIYLLKYVTQMAKKAGAVYLGITQDTPGGLSKKAPKYINLYKELPKTLGFEEVDNPYLGATIEREYSLEEFREDEDMYEYSVGSFIKNDFLMNMERYGYVDWYNEGQYPDCPDDSFIVTHKFSELYAQTFAQREKALKALKVEQKRRAQAYIDSGEETIKSAALRRATQEMEDNGEDHAILYDEQYCIPFVKAAKNAFIKSGEEDYYFEEWKDMQQEREGENQRAVEPNIWVKKIGLSIYRGLTKMHESDIKSNVIQRLDETRFFNTATNLVQNSQQEIFRINDLKKMFKSMENTPSAKMVRSIYTTVGDKSINRKNLLRLIKSIGEKKYKQKLHPFTGFHVKGDGFVHSAHIFKFSKKALTDMLSTTENPNFREWLTNAVEKSSETFHVNEKEQIGHIRYSFEKNELSEDTLFIQEIQSDLKISAMEYMDNVISFNSSIQPLKSQITNNDAVLNAINNGTKPPEFFYYRDGIGVIRSMKVGDSPDYDKLNRYQAHLKKPYDAKTEMKEFIKWFDSNIEYWHFFALEQLINNHPDVKFVALTKEFDKDSTPPQASWEKYYVATAKKFEMIDGKVKYTPEPGSISSDQFSNYLSQKGLNKEGMSYEELDQEHDEYILSLPTKKIECWITPADNFRSRVSMLHESTLLVETNFLRKVKKQLNKTLKTSNKFKDKERSSLILKKQDVINVLNDAKVKGTKLGQEVISMVSDQGISPKELNGILHKVGHKGFKQSNTRYSGYYRPKYSGYHPTMVFQFSVKALEDMIEDAPFPEWKEWLKGQTDRLAPKIHFNNKMQIGHIRYDLDFEHEGEKTLWIQEIQTDLRTNALTFAKSFSNGLVKSDFEYAIKINKEMLSRLEREPEKPINSVELGAASYKKFDDDSVDIVNRFIRSSDNFIDPPERKGWINIIKQENEKLEKVMNGFSGYDQAAFMKWFDKHLSRWHYYALHRLFKQAKNKGAKYVAISQKYNVGGEVPEEKLLTFYKAVAEKLDMKDIQPKDKELTNQELMKWAYNYFRQDAIDDFDEMYNNFYSFKNIHMYGDPTSRSYYEKFIIKAIYEYIIRKKLKETLSILFDKKEILTKDEFENQQQLNLGSAFKQTYEDYLSNKITPLQELAGDVDSLLNDRKASATHYFDNSTAVWKEKRMPKDYNNIFDFALTEFDNREITKFAEQLYNNEYEHYGDLYLHAEKTEISDSYVEEYVDNRYPDEDDLREVYDNEHGDGSSRGDYPYWVAPIDQALAKIEPLHESTLKDKIKKLIMERMRK